MVDVDKDSCIGCATCVGLCPVDAIALNDDSKAYIDEERCMKCHSCESMCPVSAIKID